jgi:hypothetical protein
MATLRDDVSAVPDPVSGGDGTKSAHVGTDCLMNHSRISFLSSKHPAILRFRLEERQAEGCRTARPKIAQYRSFSQSKATLLERVMSGRCSLMYSLADIFLMSRGLRCRKSSAGARNQLRSLRVGQGGGCWRRVLGVFCCPATYSLWTGAFVLN